MAKVTLEQLQRESRNRHIGKTLPKRKSKNRVTVIRMENRIVDWEKVIKFASK